MEYEVILTPSALLDLEEVHDYLRMHDSAVAQRMCGKLLDSAFKLRRFPSQGGLLKYPTPVRFLVCRPFLIIYEIQEERQIVKILRFWHSSRDQGRLRLDG